MQPTAEKLAFTVDEAAFAIGISRSSFWNLVQSGAVETFKLAGRTLVRRDVLQAVVDRASGRPLAVAG